MKICKFCGKEFENLRTHANNCTERFSQTQQTIKDHGDEIISLYEKGISLNEIKDRFIIGRKELEKYIQQRGIHLKNISESKTPHVFKKQQHTIEKLYGEKVNNISQLQKIKDKVKKTMLEKYGVENISHSQRFKDFMYILKGNALDRTAYNKYKKEVWHLTKKNIKDKQFTGMCHYTGVSISKENYYNDFHHASIDHKVSVSYGFNNNIPAEQIGAKDNLCYCSRLANTVKREMTEEEFLNSDVFRRLLQYEDKISRTPAS